MDNNVIIVGIGGVTNGGKTTLAQSLHKQFPSSQIIGQDTYFKLPGDSSLTYLSHVKHSDWEVLGAVDMDQMMVVVHRKINEMSHEYPSASVETAPPVLIIEGFLVFNHRELSSLFSLKYFLTLDKETCKTRRSRRTYDPPDPDNFLEGHAWPMYLKNKAEVKEQTDIVYIDGRLDQDTILSQIVNDVQKMVENRTIYRK